MSELGHEGRTLPGLSQGRNGTKGMRLVFSRRLDRGKGTLLDKICDQEPRPKLAKLMGIFNLRSSGPS